MKSFPAGVRIEREQPYGRCRTALSFGLALSLMAASAQLGAQATPVEIPNKGAQGRDNVDKGTAPVVPTPHPGAGDAKASAPGSGATSAPGMTSVPSGGNAPDSAQGAGAAEGKGPGGAQATGAAASAPGVMVPGGSGPRTATGENVGTPREGDDDIVERVTPLQRKPRRLDPTPGWGLGLDTYAGVALQQNDQSHSHVLGGVLPRVRYRYFQLGGIVEFSSRDEASWRLLGGFLGAWLPFQNWVDFEGTVGLAVRTYMNPDLRYGPQGYNIDTGALVLRVGVSDRSASGLLGARLGAAIVTAIDFRQRSPNWSYESVVPGKDAVTVLGSTIVGGASVALVVSAGFDVSFIDESARPAKSSTDNTSGE